LSENSTAAIQIENQTETVPAFGYELIREVLLPEILGNDTPEILYWAGKRLARRFPLNSLDDMSDFFSQAGWGNLKIVNEAKNELQFELSSSLITQRIQSKEKHHFQLEAGFLAEQLEMQKQMVCEAFEHPRKRASKVHFTVKWDKKDPI
jgi:predicted hydrocarbon binding protein